MSLMARISTMAFDDCANMNNEVKNIPTNNLQGDLKNTYVIIK